MIILQRLRIQNFAIVAEVEIEFERGLTVVTGETGAGKSLLLGAFTLLLGERASSDYVRAGSKRATIEAEFAGDLSRVEHILKGEDLEFDPERLLLAREISADGRSRCLVNEQQVNLTVLRVLGSELCDLHGQHQHQWLLDPGRHVWFLDRFADCLTLQERYVAQFQRFRSARTRIAELERKLAADRDRRDLYTFQLGEIDAAAIKPDEEESLEEEQRQLENIARIRQSLQAATDRLEADGAAISQIVEIEHELRNITGSFKPAEELRADLESAKITLTELNRTIAEHATRLEEDPNRLEEVSERLSLIYNLKRKYGGSVKSLQQYREEVVAYLEAGESASSELDDLREQFESRSRDLVKAANELQTAREKGATKLARQIKKILRELGMPEAQFVVEFSECESGERVELDGKEQRLGESGPQEVQFLISANPGEPVRPLAKIASGGEISRVMLALKSLIAGKDQVDVLLFDEIDSGIGGNTAMLVGKHLSRLAEDHQVIAITHLQQIAAFADHHYRVAKQQSKGRSESYLEKLDDAERLVELGRMISGGRFGEEEKRQAEKLLAASGRKVSVDSGGG